MSIAVGTMCGSALKGGSLGGNGVMRNGRNGRKRDAGVCSASFGAVGNQYRMGDQYYKTLKVQPGANETEVKKAFRQLAKQYHPDVCKGSNCGVQFSRINEAYDIVMRNLKGELSNLRLLNHTSNGEEVYEEGDDEDWSGWEGGWVPNYTSENSPYIYDY